ncbi:lytic polysaccharide monooxygenase [Photobacterium japonica]|uniref:lytic polysaccharide monooxygenase n=1 Tax=Photobacterium japonica TaxID=2910235 RepID=UPI003D13D6AD
MSPMNKLSIAVLAAVANLATIQTASAHGWAEFPSARQSTCYTDGGYWTNEIPNAACQKAFDKSGNYAFLQRNEVAALTADYNNIEAVKQQVPNGELCAAGDTQKSGLDVTSPDWQQTTVTLDENGEFEFVWTATAPHNPSFWEFYLTKPGHDFTQPLNWEDLELVDTAGNIAPEATSPYKTYRFNVQLPKDREGDAVLYTRWQRIDPAGEGFYNCSDIVIKQSDGGITPPPPVEDGKLNAIEGYFVPAGYPVPAIGDTMRLRTMDGNGNEQIDERLLITAFNQATWAQDLANQVNTQHAGKWAVGVWDQAAAEYRFDEKNIHANRVWSSEKDSAFALSTLKPIDPPPPVVDPELPEGAWDKTATYVENDVVTHNGKTWKAGWWNQNEEPGVSNVWKRVLTDGEEPEVGAWSASSEYNTNDVVTHDNAEWKAAWWTKGEEPGTTGEWGVWRKL